MGSTRVGFLLALCLFALLGASCDPLSGLLPPTPTAATPLVYYSPTPTAPRATPTRPPILAPSPAATVRAGTDGRGDRQARAAADPRVALPFADASGVAFAADNTRASHARAKPDWLSDDWWHVADADPFADAALDSRRGLDDTP